MTPPDSHVPHRSQFANATTRSARPGFYHRIGKRALDLSFGAIALLIALPLMAVTVLALRMSIGPGILFRQTRVGRHGTNFEMLKFRTMLPSRRQTADTYRGPDRRTSHKVPHDPRHTTVGRWLRKVSLDELPQLINVICGEMSLVGPRPEMAAVVDRHGLRDHPRHMVRPGLTGAWQVGERAHGAPLHQCFDGDLDYVRSITLRNDLKIIWRTFGAIVRGTGS